MAKEQDKKTTSTTDDTTAAKSAAPAPRRYKYKGPKYVPGMQRLTGDGGRYFDPIMMKDDEIDKLKKSNPDLVTKWWTEI